MSEKTHHVSEKKKQIAKNIQKLILDYPIIAAVNMENLPTPQLQQMKSQLRGKIELTMTKRRIMKHAIDGIKDKKKNIEQLIPNLKGMPALIFTKENPFSLFKTLKKSKTSAPAKAGQTAPFDLIVPKGPTSFAPGPVIGELAQLGIKSGVEGGKVAIKEDSTVVKEGEKISPKAAEILTRLGIKPMEVGLNVTAVYENGEIFTKDILDIDEEKFIKNLQKAVSGSFNLSIYIAYPTKTTINVLIGKAFNDAKSLGLSQNIIDKGIIEELVSKAERSALSLKTTAKVETAEKPKEEKKEELKVEEKQPEVKPEEKPKEEPKKEEAPKVEEKKEEVKIEEKLLKSKISKGFEKSKTFQNKPEEVPKVEEPTPTEKKEEKVLEEEKGIIKEEKKLEKEEKPKIEAPVEKEVEKEVKEEEEKQLEKERIEKEKEIEKIEEKKKAEEERKKQEEEKRRAEEEQRKQEEQRKEEAKIEEKRKTEETKRKEEERRKAEEAPKAEEPQDDTDKKIKEMVAKTKKFVKGEIPDAEKLVEEASKLAAKEVKKEPELEIKEIPTPQIKEKKEAPKVEEAKKVPTIQDLKELERKRVKVKEEKKEDTKKKKKEQEEVEDLAQELIKKGTLRK